MALKRVKLGHLLRNSSKVLTLWGHSVQKAFIVKPKLKLGLQPFPQASCEQRVVPETLRLRLTQLGLLLRFTHHALAAGPDDPLVLIIICRERSQLLLVSTRTLQALGVP